MAMASASRNPRSRLSADQSIGLLEAVNEIASAMATCLDPSRLTLEVVETVKRLLCADAATVFVLEKDGMLSCDLVEGGVEELAGSLYLRPGEGIAGWVASRREPVVIGDVEGDHRFAKRVDCETGYHTRTAMAVPLILAGELVGVLQVVNRSDGLPFCEQHLEILETLAPHVAVALTNAKATEELRGHASDLQTELEQRIGQVMTAKQEWEATVDAFHDTILLVDESRRVKRANTTTSRRAGLPVRAVPGRSCHEVAFGLHAPCDGCPLPRALEGHITRAELRVGNEVHQASHYPIKNESGAITSVACSYRDVTSARQMESRLMEAERMASVGRLAAGIAHEINNPIAFMSANIGVLEEYFGELASAVSDSEQAAEGDGSERSRRIGAGGKHVDVSRIVEDGLALLEDLRIGAERISCIVKQLGAFCHERQTVEKPVDLGNCVDRVVRRVVAEHPDACITVSKSTGLMVRGCEASFDEAIFALTHNAVQVSPQSVRISLQDDGDMIYLSVEDDGPGIAEELRTRVFEPFFTTKDVGDGLGLGLSTVYTTARRHLGSVVIEEADGGGARVALRIPKVICDDGESED